MKICLPKAEHAKQVVDDATGNARRESLLRHKAYLYEDFSKANIPIPLSLLLQEPSNL